MQHTDSVCARHMPIEAEWHAVHDASSALTYHLCLVCLVNGSVLKLSATQMYWSGLAEPQHCPVPVAAFSGCRCLSTLHLGWVPGQQEQL